eukprot:m.852323 g.852323  ORF g.852323 m.852323 type:complete len:657 (-) comp59598_c0_seq1:2279-4249(-)
MHLRTLLIVALLALVCSCAGQGEGQADCGTASALATEHVDGQSDKEMIEPTPAPAPPPPAARKASSTQTLLKIAAYTGHLTRVEQHVRKYPEDLNALDESGMTAVHHALVGCHDSMMAVHDSTNRVTGRFEETIGALVSQPSFDGSAGCPLYYAIQFRNVPAIRALLAVPDVDATLGCIEEFDSHNETVFHTLARAKLSGLARFFWHELNQAAKKNPQVAGNDASRLAYRSLALRTIDVQLARPRDLRELTYPDMIDALGHGDLKAMLTFVRKKNSTLIHRPGWGGNTPLHLAAQEGNLEAVRLLIKHGGDVRARNDFGQTPLHLACCAGFTSVMDLLVQMGAGLDARDNFGRTCTLTAAIHGHSAVLKWLLDHTANLEVRDQRGLKAQEHAAEISISGAFLKLAHLNSKMLIHEWRPEDMHSGWDLPVEPVSFSCSIPRVSADIGKEEFERDFLSLGRPVIISGALTNASSARLWTKSSFSRTYGSQKVDVGPVPYAKTYGQSTAQLTLQEFIEKHMTSSSGTEEDQLYVFDPSLFGRNPAIQEEVPISPLFDRISILQQFMLGGTGTGAPPHFHGHAANHLVFGQKEWILFPPAEAFFAFQTSSSWFREHRQSAPSSALRCMQFGGDIAFVPAAWGHAVINHAPSIAVAYEFHE